MQTKESSLFQCRYLSNATSVNDALCTAFRLHGDAAYARKTHFFAGRYENIYISPEYIPELATLYGHAERYAREILQLDPRQALRAGGWFNRMGPGEVTLKHRHDDDDELLSAVYYLQVPKDSGALRLYDRHEVVTVQPQAGMFVFFAPATEHEVSENLSGEQRLSIGINIGPRHDE